MSRQDKLNEGQVLLNDSNNYRPLDKTMVETTTKKAQQLIKTVLPEGHIAKTAAKWLSLIRLILRKSTKLEIASTEFDKPTDNISTGERQALKELSRNKSIILKKSDKGNTTVLMSRQDKLNEGQVLLNDSNNYRPLDKTMVETTTKKAQQLIKTVLPEGHIAKTAAKWLSLIRLILRK